MCGIDTIKELKEEFMIFSIESGIVFEKDIPHEITVIMRKISFSSDKKTIFTEKINISKFSEIISKLDGTITLGSILEKKYSLKKDGWYDFFLGTSRREVIMNSLIKNF